MKGRSVVWWGLKAPAGTKPLHEDSDGEKGRELRWDRRQLGPMPGSHHVQPQWGSSGSGQERTEASESLCWGCHSHGSHLEAVPPAQCPLQMRPQPLAATSTEG